MKRLIAFLKEEKGAAQMIEATVLYPIVFLIIFLMIYVGLYILQAITVGVYAQKVAILASREISQPGYRTLISDEKYSSTAVELAVDGNAETYKGSININVNNMAKEVTDNFTVIYRYFGNPLNNKNKKYYEDILTELVSKNSLIRPSDNGGLHVDIDCENNFIAQFITVEVKQELYHFALLDAFGIESPTVSGKAVATVSDTDELVRTTDFAVDAMSALASKLGINVDNLKDTVKKALETLGLI